MYGTEVKVSKEKTGAMGRVIEVLKGDRFRVRLDNGHEILAEPSGRMQYYIRILLGDRVKVELSSHDPTQGRILYRYRC
jgi:translation initiation factor IF-1